MEEEKKLYPFRLCSIEDAYSWGSEEFHIADLGYRDSIVRDGWLAGNALSEVIETYLDRLVGDNVFEWYGSQFPFQVKLLKVRGRMPLRVSPADELARQRYDALGKEKLWYVARAGREARLLLGFRVDTEASQFYNACTEGEPELFLNSVPLKAGQYYHIPAGVPHCIWGDADIVETSESSAMDFCLSGWGNEVSDEEFDPALGLVEALDFLEYRKLPSEKLLGFSMERGEDGPGNVVRMLHLPQFTSRLITLGDALKISSGNADSCVSYTCLRGEFSIQLPQDGDEKIDYLVVKAMETVLVPAELEEFYLVPRASGTLLLETLVERRPETDSYVAADAGPLPDEEED